LKIYEYTKGFGEYVADAELRAKLAPRPISEQAEYFGVTESVIISKTGFGANAARGVVARLEDSKYVRGMIVDEGMIVGIILKNEYGGESPCFIGGGVCVYSSSDNNGAGYTERDDYLYLVTKND
jgi:hypothetical protein